MANSVQILIPDWTYFHCPGTTLVHMQARSVGRVVQITSNDGVIMVLNKVEQLVCTLSKSIAGSNYPPWRIETTLVRWISLKIFFPTIYL